MKRLAGLLLEEDIWKSCSGLGPMDAHGENILVLKLLKEVI